MTIAYGITDADSSVRVTVVDGTTYTGMYAADGSINVVEVDGSEYAGVQDGCGAINVIVVTEDNTGGMFHACGALIVSESPYYKNTTKVTVVSGSFSSGTETLTISQASPTTQAIPACDITGITGEVIGDIIRVTLDGIDYDDTIDASDLVTLLLDFNFPALSNGDHTWQAFHLDSSEVVIASSPETTLTISDVTDPVIDTPTSSVVSSTLIRGGFNSNEAGGVGYGVASTSSTQPTETQIRAGQNHLGATVPSGTVTPPIIGTNTIDITVSDFSTRYIHILHRDAGLNDSNIITSAAVTPYATPAELTGFTDWWDLGDGATVTPYLSGGGITRVDNKIGSVNLVTSNTGSANHRPLYNETVNGRNVAVFNNTGSSMNLGAYTSVPATLTGGTFYQYIVFKVATGGVDNTSDTVFICTDPSNPRYDYSIQANNASAFDGRLNLRELGTSQNFSPSGVSLNTTHLLEIEFTASTNLKVWLDNTLVATATHAQTALAATTMAFFLNGVNPLYGQLNESGFSTTLYRGLGNRAGLIAGINTRWGTSFS